MRTTIRSAAWLPKRRPCVRPGFSPPPRHRQEAFHYGANRSAAPAAGGSLRPRSSRRTTMTVMPSLRDPVDAQTPRSRAALLERYREVRRFTETLCAPLETEDYVVQPMPDASPAKWHLAHTSWFFETFVLKPHAPRYHEIDPAYAYLFNSYYMRAGARHCRDQRGMVTRPTVRQTYAYRAHVDRQVEDLLVGADEPLLEVLAPLVTLGTHHEQQHQELLVTDVKYLFSRNPLRPAYDPGKAPEPPSKAPA